MSRSLRAVPVARTALSLILLAQNRNGYGNLSELITIGRTRSEKGTYLLTPDDLALCRNKGGAKAMDLAGVSHEDRDATITAAAHRVFLHTARRGKRTDLHLRGAV